MRFRIAQIEGKGNPGGQKGESEPSGTKHIMCLVRNKQAGLTGASCVLV